MKKFLENGYFYLGLILFTLFIGLFSVKLISIFTIIIVVFWSLWVKDFSNFKEQKKMLWPYFAYIGIVLIGFLFSGDKYNALKQLERIVPFLVIPLVFLFIKWNNKKHEFFGRTFVYCVLFISVLSVVLLLYFKVTHTEFLLKMDKNYLQWKLPHLIGFHPAYFGLYIVTATIILLFDDTIYVDKKKIFFRVAIVILFTIYLLYISSRNALFCQFLVLGYFIYCFLKSFMNMNIFTTIFIFLFFIISLTLAVLQSNYLSNKLSRIYEDDRFMLWPYALNKIKDNHFFLGEGLGEGSIYLENIISKIDDKRIYYKGTDLHNQYLKNYLDFGIFGFIGLAILLFWPLYFIKDKSLFLFIAVFSIAIFTESMLSVIKGIMFFNFMSLYFIQKNLNQYKKNEFFKSKYF